MRLLFVAAVVLLAVSLRAQGSPVDSTWSSFLSNLYDNDKNAPKTLSINQVESKKGFITALGSEVNEPGYHLFQQFVESRNFNRYFEYLKKTELYKQMQRAVALEFNLPDEAQDKLISGMWEAYFKNGSNDLPNWYAYYLQEQQGKLRTERIVDQRGVHAAWFKDENGQTVKRTFFTGTSPEFDFVAFTLCALQTTRERQNAKCSFELGGNPVTTAVLVRRVRDEISILRAEPRQANYLRDVPELHRPKPKPKAPTDLQKLIDDLWAADEDRAPDGYVKLDWQEKIKRGSGRALNPLFSSVNETLFERPIYKTLIEIYTKKLFTPNVCNAEKPLAGEKLTTLKQFFDLLTGSKCFNIAYEYLKKHGRAEQDYDKFLEKVWNLWYGTYTRCRGTKGSSGFEHIFAGETKDRKVDGHHSWVSYYLLEKAHEMSYYGYYVHADRYIGTFKYKWNATIKEKGGFFIATSPAFDFSVFTTCTLLFTGNQRCRFELDNSPLFVTSFTQPCTTGTCLATSYPGIVE